MAGREAEEHPERPCRDLRHHLRAGVVRTRSDSSIRPRHASGAASICNIVNDTGSPRSSDSFTIHAISRSGARRSSPEAPAGASSNTARPPRCMARPSANSSSSAANVPGTGRPSMARCPSVREVEKPSAPASTASCTIAAIAAKLVVQGMLTMFVENVPRRHITPPHSGIAQSGDKEQMRHDAGWKDPVHQTCVERCSRVERLQASFDALPYLLAAAQHPFALCKSLAHLRCKAKQRTFSIVHNYRVGCATQRCCQVVVAKHLFRFAD